MPQNTMRLFSGTIGAMLLVVAAYAADEMPTPAAPARESAIAALQDGFYSVAERYLNHWFRVAPTREEQTQATALLAQALHGQRRFEDLLDLLSARADLARSTAERGVFAYWRALASFELGEPEMALELLAALPIRQLSADIQQSTLRLQAKCLVMLERDEEALDVLRDFHTRFSDTPDVERNELELAALLLANQKSEEALPMLEALAAGPPDSLTAARARLLHARWHLDRNEHAAAEVLLRPLAAQSAAPPTARAEASLLLAESASLQKDWTAALEALDQLADLPGLLPRLTNEARIQRGLVLVLAGRHEEGIPLAREAIAERAEEPDAAQFQIKLAENLLIANRPREAESEFRHYLEAFTDPGGVVRALLGRGWSLLTLERFEEAAAVFERAIETASDPDFRREALAKAADAYFMAGLYAEARASYQRLTREFPGGPEAVQALYQAAEALARLGDSVAATQEYLALEDAHPDQPFANLAALRVASLHEQAGRWQDALQAYESALRRYSQGSYAARLFHGRGLIRYRLGLFEPALEDFTHVVNLDADGLEEQSEYMRGWCLHLLGREDEAHAIGLRFSERYPKSAWAPDVLFWLAEAQFNRQHYEKAREHFAELAKRYPESPLAPEALFWAARAALARKEFLLALEHLNRLTEYYPDSDKIAAARFAQGDALSELGQFDAAILAFEQVSTFFPESYLADLARGRRGDCLYTLGATTPSRYADALAVFSALASRPDIPLELGLQARYKSGRCLERLERYDDALEQYLDVVYAYLSAPTPGVNGVARWFTRAAFDAAALQERRQQPRAAAHIYRRVIESEASAAAEARRRLQRLQIESWWPRP